MPGSRMPFREGYWYCFDVPMVWRARLMAGPDQHWGLHERFLGGRCLGPRVGEFDVMLFRGFPVGGTIEHYFLVERGAYKNAELCEPPAPAN